MDGRRACERVLADSVALIRSVARRQGVPVDASASLLEIFHAYDAAATDLLVHALAVGIVVMVNAAMGGRLLSRR